MKRERENSGSPMAERAAETVRGQKGHHCSEDRWEALEEIGPGARNPFEPAASRRRRPRVRWAHGGVELAFERGTAVRAPDGQVADREGHRHFAVP